jgi:hypothetical protein
MVEGWLSPQSVSGRRGQHLVIGYADLVLPSEHCSGGESPEIAAKNARDSLHAWGPACYSPDMVMIQFVERGRIVREVTLHELMPDLSKMIKTASSWHWGDFSPGLNGRGEFVVKTVDYRELHFDVKTGRLVMVDRMYRAWLRDLMWPPYRHALLSLAIGIVIGISFRNRLGHALLMSIAVSIGLLFFALWMNGDFATGTYSFVPLLTVLYLIPSGLAVIVMSFVWRLAGQSINKPCGS